MAAPRSDLEWYGSSPRAAAETLGLIGIPAAVLGAGGRPLAANGLFEELMRGVAWSRGERIVFADRATDALFVKLLDAPPDAPRSIPMRARGERPPMIAHLIPARTRQVFADACSILVVTQVTPPAAPAAEVLQGLFDLTPAEARVARGIGEGRTVETIAEAFGLSRETVRSQLKAVLGKMGLGRQADLVGMLAAVDMPGA